MKIAGIQNNSFVDYPGKIAAVIFTPGCNMDCFYCHNRILIENKKTELYNSEEVLKLIKTRREFLDAVVITGGEPTLQPELEKYIIKIKEIGLKVKLDTNGTNPNSLKKLISDNLVDYIAMDIKAPLERYDEITGVKVNINNIKKSIKIIMGSQLKYEFRTTFIPQLNNQDIKKIAKLIVGAKRYVLQQYRKPELNTKHIDIRLAKEAHRPDYIKDVCKDIKHNFQKCETRGL